MPDAEWLERRLNTLEMKSDKRFDKLEEKIDKKFDDLPCAERAAELKTYTVKFNNHLSERDREAKGNEMSWKKVAVVIALLQVVMAGVNILVVKLL